MDKDRHIPEPTDTERAQWAALRSGVDAVTAGVLRGQLDAATGAAGVNQLRQIPFNDERFRDALHVPRDAGEYREQLESILRRIPDGWGRWLSVKAGWYPLICEIDDELRALDEGYEIHQVKSKFAGLRYYAYTENKAIKAQFRAIISEGENRSEAICELCGSDRASLHVTVPFRYQWTLCTNCAETRTTRSGQRFEPVKRAGK